MGLTRGSGVALFQYWASRYIHIKPARMPPNVNNPLQTRINVLKYEVFNVEYIL